MISKLLCFSYLFRSNYIATVFEILIQDGKKYHYLLAKFQMTVFLQIRIRCEYESLISVGNVRTRNQSKSIDAK